MPPRRQARSASRLDRKSVHFLCSLGGRAWPMIPPRIRLFVDLIADLGRGAHRQLLRRMVRASLNWEDTMTSNTQSQDNRILTDARTQRHQANLSGPLSAKPRHERGSPLRAA
jgi:hypothetical protein